jgi:hypothetical protein
MLEWKNGWELRRYGKRTAHQPVGRSLVLQGLFFWTSTGKQTVYYVVLEDSAGNKRKGWGAVAAGGLVCSRTRSSTSKFEISLFLVRHFRNIVYRTRSFEWRGHQTLSDRSAKWF